MVKKKRKTVSKKKTVKRAKKKIVRKKATPKKKAVKKAKKSPKLPKPIGRVTHYFPHVKAAAVMIKRDGIKVGDTLHYKGYTTNFKQTVESLQIEHQSVSQAGPGDEVGIRVRSRVREHDLVFKL